MITDVLGIYDYEIETTQKLMTILILDDRTQAIKISLFGEQCNEILKIKVLDPAMGSGHFLVEACRFMAEKLYEACRLCDEKSLDLQRKAEKERPSFDFEDKMEEFSLK